MHQDVYDKGLHNHEWDPKSENEAFSFLSPLKSFDFHICFNSVYVFVTSRQYTC